MNFASHDEWKSFPDTGAMNKLPPCDVFQFLEGPGDHRGVFLHSSELQQALQRYYRKTAELDLSPWQVLALLMTSNKEAERLEVIRALIRGGKQACLEALFPLREALGDSSEEVRIEAIEALALLGEDAPIDALMCALTDFSWKVRTTAAQALGNTGRNMPSSYLALLLKQERDANVREAMVRALGKLEYAIPVDVVTSILLEDCNWLVRTAAAWALGALRTNTSIQPLLTALRRDQDESVRAAAAKALGKVGDKAVLEPLLEALKDPEEEVRDAAEWALQQLDNETRGLTHRGSVYHFNQQLSPQAQAFFALTEFIGDKKGWVGQANMSQSTYGPVLHLMCFYQRSEAHFQEAVQHLVKELCVLETIEEALNERDAVVQGVVKQAFETRKHRPWLDLVVVSFALTIPHNGSNPMTLRVIISGMGCQRVREQDALVLDQLIDAWVKAVDEPSMYERLEELADLKIWYHSGSHPVPQVAAS